MTTTHCKFSFQRLLAMIVVALALPLAGCLQVEGVHYLNHRGDSDQGSYEVSMPTVLYLAYLGDHPEGLSGLRRFSRPKTWTRDGQTYFSDTSGNAQMEHFYDRFECEPAPISGWSDCSFSMSKSDMTFPGWRVDWKVVLHKEMVVLSSNHQRRVTREGQQQLIWEFDGDRLNAFAIVFKVRVPNA